MRHLDYRMVKAIEDQRIAEARRSGTRRKPKEIRPTLVLHLKRNVGRRMIAFGQRLAAEEVEAL